jgi:hypothetical protein
LFRSKTIFLEKILRPMNLLGEAWLSFAKWEILPTLPGDSDLFQIRHGHGLTRPSETPALAMPGGRLATVEISPSHKGK